MALKGTAPPVRSGQKPPRASSSEGSVRAGSLWGTALGACNSAILKAASGKDSPPFSSATLSRDFEIINLSAREVLVENIHCYKLGVSLWAPLNPPAIPGKEMLGGRGGRERDGWSAGGEEGGVL